MVSSENIPFRQNKKKNKGKMAIEWTPWFNMPAKKRLELLSISFLLFCFLPIGLLPLVIMTMLYILVTKYIANGDALDEMRIPFNI